MTTKTAASFLYGSVISAGLALLTFSTALADTATGSLGVSAQVVATCHVVGGGATLDFGAYSPAEVADHDVSTEFSIQCSTLTTVGVALGGGDNNPTGIQRRMAGEGTFLNYALYEDDDRTTTFGDDGALGPGTSVPITAANTPTPVSVYGRIPKQQAVPTGAYHDSVQISIEF